jgi:hypothetical protein
MQARKRKQRWDKAYLKYKHYYIKISKEDMHSPKNDICPRI